MEKYTHEGTSETPTINFDFATGALEIKGRSIPENSFEFYKPLIEAIDNYSVSAQPNTQVNILLEFFNTTSSKCILDVFKKLEGIHRDGRSVNINWGYKSDDEDMFEAGEDYQAIINIPFKMIQREE